MNYLDMAIKLETEGETFYLEQADKNRAIKVDKNAIL